jgi:hypothetical protein
MMRTEAIAPGNRLCARKRNYNPEVGAEFRHEKKGYIAETDPIVRLIYLSKRRRGHPYKRKICLRHYSMWRQLEG